MRQRTITIAAPQHRHVSLGRSLKGGCVDHGCMDGGCVEGCMPGVPGAMQADAALRLAATLACLDCSAHCVAVDGQTD